jgi:hypothetical protein
VRSGLSFIKSQSLILHHEGATIHCTALPSTHYACARYVQRQAKEKFRENAAGKQSASVDEQWSKARETLALVQRQAIVYTLYARKNKSIMVRFRFGVSKYESSCVFETILPQIVVPACVTLFFFSPRLPLGCSGLPRCFCAAGYAIAAGAEHSNTFKRSLDLVNNTQDFKQQVLTRHLHMPSHVSELVVRWQGRKAAM